MDLPSPRAVRSLQTLLVCQGLYYAATGIWPLLDRRTFQAVTGPKADFWLVETVGALVAVVGGTLVVAGVRGEAGPEIRLLATGSAGVLATIDIAYAARGRIPRVYLLDAALELGFVSWHIAAKP
jgi:hypothetical protein